MLALLLVGFYGTVADQLPPGAFHRMLWVHRTGEHFVKKHITPRLPVVFAQGGCAPDARACIELYQGRFVVHIAEYWLLSADRGELTWTIAHELCHAKNDHNVVARWGSMDQKEQDRRHDANAVCIYDAVKEHDDE